MQHTNILNVTCPTQPTIFVAVVCKCKINIGWVRTYADIIQSDSSPLSQKVRYA